MNQVEEVPSYITNEEYLEIEEEEDHSYYDTEDENDKDISNVNVEVESVLKSLNDIEFQNEITLTEEPRNFDDTHFEFNFDSQYERRPYETLKINFGSADLPRFSCANHKLNVAVRGAISIHHKFTQILKDLNKANSKIRRSVQLNHAFIYHHQLLHI